jgi:hypothetical protein
MGILDTRAQLGAFTDTETAVIVQRTLRTDGSNQFDDVPLYSGSADFQPQNGVTFTDPKGVVQIVDALLLIDPAANGSLPSVAISDGGPRYVAIVSGTRYDVVFANVWNASPKHLELTLKRGPQQYRAK